MRQAGLTGQLLQAFPLLVGDIGQVAGLRAETGNNQVSAKKQQILVEAPQIVAVIMTVGDDLQKLSPLPVQQGLQGLQQKTPVGHSQNTGNLGGGDFGTAEGDHLIQQTLGVAHPPLGFLGDEL